jgi:hypothetical protein
MKAGSQGTFVISWTQTEVDGLSGPPLDVLRTGVSWRWRGPAVRVDGPQDVLVLDGAEGMTDLRRRAARMVRRLVGAAVAPQGSPPADEAPEAALPDQSFVVTDGRETHVLTLIPVPDTGARLVMVMGTMPPEGSDLWVVRTAFEPGAVPPGRRQEGGVICFTPETRLATPQGQRLIRDLMPGDKVLTRDNGAQEILWMGRRRMTGARLYAMPHLRPIRFRAGALGDGQPDGDLLVSPQHRMLLRGPAARALFSEDEVLATAADLVNDRSILVDHDLREVTYVHLLFERHEILWANGIESESFHPANTALETIEEGQRAGLLALLPFAADRPEAYGAFARRNLSAPETAILRHEMAA